MGFIWKLVKSDLKENKIKNVLSGITITLTAILLTSVFMVCVNWGKADELMAIENVGEYHGVYKQLQSEQLGVLKNNIEIEKIGVLSEIGFFQQEDVELSVEFMDTDAVELSGIKFIEGSMPKQKYEIAIQEGYLKYIDEEINIGDTVKIEIKSNDTADIKEGEFIVSGVLKDGKHNLWNKSYLALISEAFFKEADEAVNLDTYVRVNGEDELSGRGMKSKVEDIAKKIGIDRGNVKINKEYIDAKNVDMSILGGAIVIGIFVMISSVLVIYSIFYVSILSRVQEFGKLRAIGATKKQIKSIIFREGMIIGFVFIPVGIFLGSIVGNLVVDKVINQSTYNIKGINLMVFLSVFVLCLLSVFIALAKPMKIAAGISTIDAMRFDGEEADRKKERKGYEFLTIGRLTYANIVRNRKRTIITMVSLSLSGILFMVMSTIMSSVSGERLVKSHMKGEFLLTLSNYTHGEGERPILSDFNIVQLNNPLGEETRNEILQLPGVNGIERMGSVWADLKLPSGEIERNGLGGFDEEDFQWIEENLIEGDINYDRMMSGESLIFTYPDFAEQYGVKVGEKIKLKIYDGYNTFYKEFVVEGIASVGGEVFLIPNSVLYNIVEADITSQVEIVVEEKYTEQVNLVLEAIADSSQYVELKTMSGEIENYERVMGLIKTLGYCLVVIIGIIGFINLVNTMIASVISRRREFGILQAVGLSNKQLIKIIQMEGLFYTVGMLIISLTVGNLAAYVGFEVFVSSGAYYAIYKYPLIQTVILIATTVGGQFILACIVSRNLGKQSLVDRVKYSE